MKILLFFIINITIFFSVNLFAYAQALTPDKVFDMVKDSIIVVKTLNSEGKVKGQGSGVILPSMKIATNCHVLEGGFSYQVGRFGQFVTASLYAQDNDKDICILDAKDIDGKSVQVGKTVNLKVGVSVYAVGAPYGLELSLSNGIVSQLRGGPPPMIQTTAAISPGSSGGGLFDEEGRLIGITTLYLKGGQNLNFAMPVEWVDEIKPGIKKSVREVSSAEWLKQSLALATLKDWNGLFDWCKKWTKSDPRNATAWLTLGFTFSNLSRHSDAVGAFNQAIRLQPDLAAAYGGRGTAYHELDQYQKAIADYNESIRLEPSSADVYRLRGLVYEDIGQYNLAIADYNTAIKLQPELAFSYILRGRIYGMLGQYQQAVEDSNKAIILQADSAEAYDLRAGAYSGLGQYNLAIADYNTAIKLKPDLAAAYGGRGNIYFALGHYQNAISDYNEAIRLEPSSSVGARCYYNRGNVYLQIKKYNLAIADFNEAIRLNPSDGAYYNNRGAAYFLVGKNEQGCQDVKKACLLGSCKLSKSSKESGRCR